MKPVTKGGHVILYSGIVKDRWNPRGRLIMFATEPFDENATLERRDFPVIFFEENEDRDPDEDDLRYLGCA